jgi:Inner membrane protein YgaP-like, transmembrane domain
MEKNVGGVDQKGRLVLGFLALGIAAFAEIPTWGTVVLGTVGVIALLTGSTGYCPVWTLFGLNTCTLKKRT